MPKFCCRESGKELKKLFSVAKLIRTTTSVVRKKIETIETIDVRNMYIKLMYMSKVLSKFSKQVDLPKFKSVEEIVFEFVKSSGGAIAAIEIAI